MAIGLYNSHPRMVGLLPDAYFERSTEHSQCKTLIVPVNLPVAIGHRNGIAPVGYRRSRCCGHGTAAHGHRLIASQQHDPGATPREWPALTAVWLLVSRCGNGPSWIIPLRSPSAYSPTIKAWSIGKPGDPQQPWPIGAHPTPVSYSRVRARPRYALPPCTGPLLQLSASLRVLLG